MLHILLMILKIIGIILLAILGILILSLCVVFLVPLRYQVTAYLNGELKKSNIQIKFSWLLHLMSGHVSYLNEKLDYKIRVLWKNITEEEPTHYEESKEYVSEKEHIQEKEIKPDNVVENKIEKSETIEEVKKEKKSTKKNKFENLKCTIKDVCDKIKRVIEFLKAEAHQATLLRIKKEIARLLAFLKPKKLKGNVHYGMDDPYRTGQILAILSVLYPFYGESVEIYPDFEQKILEGELHIKGHVRGVYALIMAINLLLDKNVRTTIKDIKALF